MRKLLFATTLLCGQAWADPPQGVSVGRDVSGYFLSGRTLAARSTDIINVMDTPFGAKGDGITNDTNAIQNAVLAAEARLSTANYWSQTSLPAVYLPPGNYMVGGIDVRRAIRFFSDGPGAATLTLIAGSNRSVLRSIAQPQTDPVPWAQYSQPTFTGFSINGNSAAQTGGVSNGIELQDAAYTQSTRYGSGARIRDVNIIAAAGAGVYVGKNRNFGFLNNVIINYAQDDCVYFNTANDWDISGLSAGACVYNGVNMYYSSQIRISNSDIYNNQGNGVLLNQGFGTGYLWINNSTIGANNTHGLAIMQSPLNTSGMVGLSNVQLTDNSLGANNVSSQIYTRNLASLALNNVQIYYQGSGNNAKFIIDNDTSGYISVSGLSYLTAAGNAPYATAAFANPSYVLGPINPQGGKFALNVPLTLSRGGAITSTTQYDGFSISNGVNTVAAMQGTGASNDNGALSLYSGGTQQVGLSATAQSSINQGLTVGNNLTTSGSVSGRRVAVADAAYTAQSNDYMIAYTSLTATRAVTLPCSSTGSSGAAKVFIIKDESGQAGTFPITLVGTIDGVTNKSVASAYGSVRLYTNGTACFTW